jgi:hypothetical protein
LLRRPCTTWTMISRSREVSDSRRFVSALKILSFSRRE